MIRLGVSLCLAGVLAGCGPQVMASYSDRVTVRYVTGNDQSVEAIARAECARHGKRLGPQVSERANDPHAAKAEIWRSYDCI